MTLFTWVKDQQKNLQDSISKFRNKEFMDAVVAGCALVATADGNIDSAEKQKMAGFISRSKELRVFDMNHVINRFNHFVSDFEFNSIIGKGEALKAIGKLKNNPEASRLVVRVCCAIGSADHNFYEYEKQVIREICHHLNLTLSEFHL
ncbi:MAG: tellurite resistance TerB family protein [Nostoc sp. ChiQUE02]|uniref:tellurite resistance TerB family protein n=1 Tax=Nostoc sp. ChiQUE02 TaxID=3075377 RepID=UPI002AD49638|nr:tellurite resistance TerB family protein [Nostoc sp. ChiQUE02]MDZ8235111.1 tellurite resistance TerB family protein [Nostoc sp. ChiQUE02]